MPIMDSLFNWGPFSRTRRNHALEHATLQVLAQKNPKLRMAGYSDTGGFWVIGDVEIEDLQAAVEEARTRLLAGEHSLAIHPNCGTNFVTTGLVAGSFAWLAMQGGGKRGLRDELDRLPLMIALVTFGMILSQPLGPLAQARLTTEPRLGSLKVTGVMRYKRGDAPLHRVSTQF